MLALVDGMRSRGVPVTGAGFQMHVLLDWPSISAIESSLKAAADRRLKVKITELDVSMKNTYSSFTLEAGERQKQRYHDIVAAYLRAVPAAQRAGITVGGVADADSWINEPNRSTASCLHGGCRPTSRGHGLRPSPWSLHR
jgi:endo-1,4-beta-xylanase